MKAGRFIKGIFNGTTEAYQTQGVEKLLSQEEFDKLWNLEDIGAWLYINPEEAVIARSTITKTNDGEFTGRKGIINHTILAKWDDTCNKDNAVYRLDRTTINESIAPVILFLPFPEKLTQPLPPIEP